MLNKHSARRQVAHTQVQVRKIDCYVAHRRVGIFLWAVRELSHVPSAINTDSGRELFQNVITTKLVRGIIEFELLSLATTGSQLNYILASFYLILQIGHCTHTDR